MRFEEVRARLARLPAGLPPPPADLMPIAVAGPGGRPPVLPEFPASPRRPAAVLILIHPDADGQACLVLTERSAGGHRHAGQISLPGGAIEAEDATPADAALREAREEVGLDAAQAGVAIHGTLPALDARVSGFLVYPVVAFAERPPVLIPDGHEVAAILTAPVSAFLVNAPIEMAEEEREGFRLRYGAYRVGDHLVWGFTASILGRLGAYISSVPGA